MHVMDINGWHSPFYRVAKQYTLIIDEKKKNLEINSSGQYCPLKKNSDSAMKSITVLSG